MGRAGRLAFGAILGSMALTLALVAALDPPAPGASAAPISAADAHPDPSVVPGHCRSATMPDPQCAAAWEARREAFFGAKDYEP